MRNNNGPLNNHQGTNSIAVRRNGVKSKWKEIMGPSPLIESYNLAHYAGVERLYLKFEGGNPTGTQKDRIAIALAEDAKAQGSTGILTATCGNFGAALANAAKLFNIPAHIFIPQGYHLAKDRMKRILDTGAELHYEEGQYEDLVLLSSKIAEENGWYDANPGKENVKRISLDSYAEVAFEIFREIRRLPNFVFCPVGNGTTLAGIHLGFKRLLLNGRINSLPRMVATSTRRGNPIIKSFKLKSRTILDLERTEVKESRVNEPLTNWHSFDGQEALDAIYESDGFAEYASDSKMIEYARVLRQEEGLNVLPASASTLAVMSDLADSKVTLKGIFVAILTGRNFD